MMNWMQLPCSRNWASSDSCLRGFFYEQMHVRDMHLHLISLLVWSMQYSALCHSLKMKKNELRSEMCFVFWFLFVSWFNCSYLSLYFSFMNQNQMQYTPSTNRCVFLCCEWMWRWICKNVYERACTFLRGLWINTNFKTYYRLPKHLTSSVVNCSRGSNSTLFAHFIKFFNWSENSYFSDFNNWWIIINYWFPWRFWYFFVVLLKNLSYRFLFRKNCINWLLYLFFWK